MSSLWISLSSCANGRTSSVEYTPWEYNHSSTASAGLSFIFCGSSFCQIILSTSLVSRCSAMSLTRHRKCCLRRFDSVSIEASIAVDLKFGDDSCWLLLEFIKTFSSLDCPAMAGFYQQNSSAVLLTRHRSLCTRYKMGGANRHTRLSVP